MPLTIATVPLQTPIPQPDTRLPPKQQQAYQEEEQARPHSRQVDVKHRDTQWRGELAGERAAIESSWLNYTTARVRARHVTAAQSANF
jgi:hypothetical protein